MAQDPVRVGCTLSIDWSMLKRPARGRPKGSKVAKGSQPTLPTKEASKGNKEQDELKTEEELKRDRTHAAAPPP